MSHLTIVLLTAAAFLLILGTIKAVRTCLDNRDEEMEPIRRHHGPGYNRELLQIGSWCDEESLTVRRIPVSAWNSRDRNPTGNYASGAPRSWRSRHRD